MTTINYGTCQVCGHATPVVHPDGILHCRGIPTVFTTRPKQCTGNGALAFELSRDALADEINRVDKILGELVRERDEFRRVPGELVQYRPSVISADPDASPIWIRHLNGNPVQAVPPDFIAWHRVDWFECRNRLIAAIEVHQHAQLARFDAWEQKPLQAIEINDGGETK